MRIIDWSSDVFSSDLAKIERQPRKLAIEIAIAQRRRRRIGIGVIDDKFPNAAYYASDYESSMTPRLKSTFLASGTVIMRWAERIGSASGRGRVWKYVSVSVAPVQ